MNSFLSSIRTEREEIKIYSNICLILFYVIFKDIIDQYRVSYDIYENRVEHFERKLRER